MPPEVQDARLHVKRSLPLPRAATYWIQCVASDEIPLVRLFVISLLLACGPRPSAEVEAADEASVQIALDEEAPAAPLVEDARTDDALTEDARAEESVEVTRFLGEDESQTLVSLRDGEVTQVRSGLGGRTLAFRITLEDGTRAYYKPEQSFSAAHWYSEVAAYYLDRELGFGRVPPVVGRRLPYEPLRRVAEEDERLPELVVGPDGTVRGALIGWVEGGLIPLELGQGWERHVRVAGGLAITPYQRPSDYRALVSGEVLVEETEVGSYLPALESLSDERRGHLSDLIVFDFLIANVDRWGGGFTNVRIRRDDRDMVFLDNGAGFWPNARLGLMDARLEALQLFRRETLQRLREFDLAAFAGRLASDPLAPILDDDRIAHIGERVAAVLEHADTLVAAYGEDAVLLD